MCVIASEGGSVIPDCLVGTCNRWEMQAKVRDVFKLYIIWVNIITSNASKGQIYVLILSIVFILTRPYRVIGVQSSLSPFVGDNQRYCS